MYNILFFLIFLYLIFNLYNYFITNKIKFIGGNNKNSKEIKITNLDTCIDEVMRLNKLGKICDPADSEYNDSKEFIQAIELCKNINFTNDNDKKKIQKSINSGLFYKIKQNELQKCEKKPWVTTQENCIDSINSYIHQGLVCKDNKYVKLGLEACKKYSEPKLLRMGDEGELLYKLRDRIFKNKIPTCYNKITSCANLTENECKNSAFDERCKYDNNKCKPWFFNNYDEAFEFLKTLNITRKHKKKILDLAYNEDLDKANYFTEIYIQKFAKIPFPKKINCESQTKYLIKVKNIKPEKQNKFKNLCKTKKGKEQVSSIFSSIVDN